MGSVTAVLERQHFSTGVLGNRPVCQSLRNSIVNICAYIYVYLHQQVPHPAASPQPMQSSGFVHAEVWWSPLGGPLGCCLPWAAGFAFRLQWVLVPLICADEVGGGGCKRSVLMSGAPGKGFALARQSCSCIRPVWLGGGGQWVR